MRSNAARVEPPPAAETDEAVQLQPLRDSLKELSALHQRAVNAREAYGDLVDAVADKTKLKPAVIRAFVNARLSETGQRKVTTTKMGKWSDEARARASERMRRQWSDPAARRRRLSGMARKEARINMSTAQKKNDGRRKIDDSTVLELRNQGLKIKTIADRLGVTTATIYLALRRTAPQPERLPTSKALQAARRRMAEREARQSTQPLPVAVREPARLWNLSRDCGVSQATEPSAVPEMHGWQKILCGRLA